MEWLFFVALFIVFMHWRRRRKISLGRSMNASWEYGGGDTRRMREPRLFRKGRR